MTSWQHKTATPKRLTYKHRFVDTLPDKLEDGLLYVSVQYGTSAHNCLCGCGREVVTPIHPTKWQMMFDGINVSLYPSIGNWSLPCRSHYWMRNGSVSWADSWSDEEVAAVRSRDIANQQRYFEMIELPPTATKHTVPRPRPFWRRMADWFEEK